MQINKQLIITPEWTQQGIELREPDDHILELYKDGILIARFSQTGVTLDAIKKEIEDHGRRN